MKPCLYSVLAITLAAFSLCLTAGAQTFTITGIGTPSGSLWSQPVGVNTNGQAVGQTIYGTQTTTTATLPFVSVPVPSLGFASAGIYTLPTLGGSSGKAYSINNSGQVVGWCGDSTGVNHAFLWDSTHGTRQLDVIADSAGTTAQKMGWFLTAAVTIAANGDILCGGTHTTAGTVDARGCIWHMDNSGGVQTLRIVTVPNDGAGCNALNDIGQVLTRQTNPTTQSPEACVFDSGGGTLRYLGSVFGQGQGINNYTESVGRNGYINLPASNYGLPPGNTYLGSLGGSTGGRAINDAGQVAGFSHTKSGNTIAIFWQRGVLKDLNTLANTGSNWKLTVGNSISGLINASSGYIVGEGFFKGASAGWILTPQ